MHGTSFDYL